MKVKKRRDNPESEKLLQIDENRNGVAEHPLDDNYDKNVKIGRAHV